MFLNERAMPRLRVSELFAINPVTEALFSYLTLSDVYVSPKERSLPHPPRLSELFAINPIAEVLFSYLTLADIYVLHGVCRSLQGVVRCLQDTRLNTRAALNDFVKSCDCFRWNLGKAEGLIFGGFVLNFLGLRQQANPFLDILVEEGTLADGLIQYLCAEETYGSVGTHEVGIVPSKIRLLLTRFVRPAKQSYSLVQSLPQKFA